MEPKIPISILIPTRNEELNIEACLAPIVNWADEIVIVDSKSTDGTLEIVKRYGLTAINFEYKGGWPKKRQWALNTYKFRNKWILLLDVDEILLDDVKVEIEKAITQNSIDGFYINFQMEFLGKRLKYAYPGLKKLVLFKQGLGNYEMRLKNQDESMADMEIHEHLIVKGKTTFLKSPILHRNVNSMFRYIQKHNEYSNWEANVVLSGENSAIEPKLFGNQAERRRWIKHKLIHIPALPGGLMFIYLYFLKLGFLDGKPGLFYALFQSFQMIHTQAKVYEIKINNKSK